MVQFKRKSQRFKKKYSFRYRHLFTFSIPVLFLVWMIKYILLHRDASENINSDLLFNEKRGVPRRCSPYGCILRAKELTEKVKRDILNMKLLEGKHDVALPYGDKSKGGLSQQGKDHTVNQDRAIIVSPFVRKNTPNLQGTENDFFIAVFDGHGDLGAEVSQYLQDHFHQKLSAKMSVVGLHDLSVDMIKNFLNQTFLEIDSELPIIEGSQYNIGESGGSTASIIFRYGSNMYFANVGDSLSFLGSFDRKSQKTTILYKNRFDKPHIIEEKERIENSNGKVFIPPHPINSRVMAFNRIKKETIGLGMSRSIGDNSHKKVGVIAEPIIEVFNLNDILYTKSGQKKENIELFVVVSSDGLWRRPAFIASHFAECFFMKNEYPIIESANLIDLSTMKKIEGYGDDITVMAMTVIG